MSAKVRLTNDLKLDGSRRMTERGWDREFLDPIPLRMAASRSGSAMPATAKNEHDTARWRGATVALLLVAEHSGDTMVPRIGIMRALYPDGPAPTPRKQRARKYQIVW
jgi:hypothetical protein